MKRRSVLLGVGATTSLGLAGLARRRPPAKVEVGIWLTEEASAYPAVAERAGAYLTGALEAAGVAVTLSVGETPVSLPPVGDERGRRVAWPRMVLEGVLGLGEIDPVRDVNLLITDQKATGQSAGYAMDNVASVAGARHLARMPPASRVPTVVDYTVPAAVTQLLLHECGHAIGLDHDHGVVEAKEPTAVVSPMASGYAWAPEAVRRRQFRSTSNGCSEVSRPVPDQPCRLSLRFSACAAGSIRRYRGGLLP